MDSHTISRNARHSILPVLGVVVLVVALLSASLPAVHAQSGHAAVGTSFISTFDADTVGWSKVTGSWSRTGSGYYKCNGLTSLFASVKRMNTYTDFVYTARMKRAENDGYANALVVRGSPGTLVGDKSWNNGYYFQYSNDGDFMVWKQVSGVSTTLQFWTPTVAVVQEGWNTLKVVLYGNILGFYINNTLVYLDDDSSRTSGSVGIIYYGGPSADNLLVNWAKLNVLPAPPDLSLQSLGLPDYSVPEGEPIQLR